MVILFKLVINVFRTVKWLVEIIFTWKDIIEMISVAIDVLSFCLIFCLVMHSGDVKWNQKLNPSK